MQEKTLEVLHLYKEFRVSKKQKKIMHTDKNKIVAVDDVSFEVYKGEIFCLLGTNGAGKTTILRMISALTKPQKGQIRVEGTPIGQDETNIKKRIGFLTSELKLDDFFTPNYLFDYFGQLYHLDHKTIKERKERLFRQFGIDKFAEVKVKNLSTGMKQKVSIVISLVHNPDIIVFDEPTNGLDIVVSREVIDFLAMLKKEGKSIIVSTHIFSIVEKLADRVGIMVEGKLVCCDTYQNLTQKESIEDVFFEKYSMKGVEKND